MASHLWICLERLCKGHKLGHSSIVLCPFHILPKHACHKFEFFFTSHKRRKRGHHFPLHLPAPSPYWSYQHGMPDIMEPMDFPPNINSPDSRYLVQYLELSTTHNLHQPTIMCQNRPCHNATFKCTINNNENGDPTWSLPLMKDATI
jgi:hypothetical protein